MSKRGSPRDLTDVWTNRTTKFARVAGPGVLVKLAHGYYAVVPDEQRGR